jgi:ferritin-like protein
MCIAALDIIRHQRATIEFLQKTIRENEQRHFELLMEREDEVAVEVARGIFEEIEGSIAVHAFTSKSEDYADGMYDAIEWVDSKIANLKKKHTEVEE